MDWKNLVDDLQRIGWTQAKIGAALGGKPQSWVADIAKGRYRDLKWTDGEKLRKLHRREMRKAIRPEPSNLVAEKETANA